MSATDAQFKYPAVCKTSWGAALLYQITGEDQYRDWLARMADWYLDTQDDGGYWHPVVENCVGDVLEVTLEFVMHVKILSGALVSRPARTG
jgi:rhamnogalacturonyl hydrolase YesR